MSGTINRCCPCGDCDRTECLSGDTADTGCCVACEDLIMWSERPAFSSTQRYYLRPDEPCLIPNGWDTLTCGSFSNPSNLQYECFSEPTGDPCLVSSWPLSDCPEIICNQNNEDGDLVQRKLGKIVNYTVYADELEPVQTIYRFYDTYWRPLGLYSGDYKVHEGFNTFRPNGLSTQLPVKPDPINNSEAISPGFSRCKYETIGDSVGAGRLTMWDKSSLYYLNTCLAGESPCAKTDCISWTQGNGECTPQEIEKGYCDPNFILQPQDIKDDLLRGYIESSQQNSVINCCYPLVDPSGTRVEQYPSCECDSPWLTRYRRRKLLDDYRYTWGVDVECYNDSSYAALTNAYASPPGSHSPNYDSVYDISYNQGNNQFRLADHWLFNMTFERWWKIAEDEHGHSAIFWDIPGSSGAEPNPSIGDPSYPWQTDDLVPKFWISACSAVPFFQFEMEDALNPMNSASSTPRQPAISSGLYQQFVEIRNDHNIAYGEYKLQALWNQLANAGYFKAKDWREEQLQAYKELNQRFPNAGYQTYANKTVDQMPMLAPFRKRYYASHDLQLRKPYLRPQLVPKSAKPLQAECYIDYPGQFPTTGMTTQERQQAIDDYYFWAERQWVYFRAAPAGWTWANWNAAGSIPCDGIEPAPNEDAAILYGCGRATGDCIESWFNQPQVSYTVNNPTLNYCVDSTGLGQTLEDCYVTEIGGIYDADNPITPCACCELNCDFTFSSPGQLEQNLACKNDCFSGEVCASYIDITRCLVPEGISYSSDGNPYNLSTDEVSDELFNCGCGATPIQGCPAGECTKLSITSYCQGVHIIASQYATDNKNIQGNDECGGTSDVVSKTRCLWSAHTFLTTAQNFYRFNDIINACENNTDISMKSLWPEVKNTHIIPKNAICNNHYAAINVTCPTASQLQYADVPGCDGGVCWPWFVDVDCCGTNSGDTPDCPPPPEPGQPTKIGCLQRIACVSESHGDKWPEQYKCPPFNTTNSSKDEIINLLGYEPFCAEGP